MKIVLKFGGTSLASPKDIRNVAKTIALFSKDNKIVVRSDDEDNNRKNMLEELSTLSYQLNTDVTNPS